MDERSTRYTRFARELRKSGYSGQTFLATIPAGSTGAFEIRTTADTLLEDADGEEFRVDIHDFDFPADLKKGTPDSALVTIFDGPRLSFGPPDRTTVFEGGLESFNEAAA